MGGRDQVLVVGSVPQHPIFRSPRKPCVGLESQVQLGVQSNGRTDAGLARNGYRDIAARQAVDRCDARGRSPLPPRSGRDRHASDERLPRLESGRSAPGDAIFPAIRKGKHLDCVLPAYSDGGDPNLLFGRLSNWKALFTRIGASRVCMLELSSLTADALGSCPGRGGA
jgi:hypothetical protein